MVMMVVVVMMVTVVVKMTVVVGRERNGRGGKGREGGTLNPIGVWCCRAEGRDGQGLRQTFLQCERRG